jgi:hypothetical protein
MRASAKLLEELAEEVRKIERLFEIHGNGLCTKRASKVYARARA